jgi:predicted HAD superfamily Cof-like phosphohydrolase
VPDVKRAKLRLDLILEEVAELIDAVSGSKEENRYLQAAVLTIHKAQKLVGDAPAYEFKKADMEHVAKELSDVSYVVQGFALEFGFNLDITLGEVHSSNMSKLGEDGKPIYNEKNKVMKGPMYKLPDMKKAIYPIKEKAA